MKADGWTHRLKNKSRMPYLKIQTRSVTSDGKVPDKGMVGNTFVDQDQKFHWYLDDKVVAL